MRGTLNLSPLRVRYGILEARTLAKLREDRRAQPKRKWAINEPEKIPTISKLRGHMNNCRCDCAACQDPDFNWANCG